MDAQSLPILLPTCAIGHHEQHWPKEVQQCGTAALCVMLEQKLTSADSQPDIKAGTASGQSVMSHLQAVKVEEGCSYALIKASHDIGGGLRLHLGVQPQPDSCHIHRGQPAHPGQVLFCSKQHKVGMGKGEGEKHRDLHCLGSDKDSEMHSVGFTHCSEV